MHFSEIIGETGLFCDGDWIETKDQDPNGKVRLIQLADIGAGVFRDKSSRYITEEKAAELDCTYLQKGDILISRLGAVLGKSCIFPLAGRYITAVDVAILRIVNPAVSPEYICYMLNSAPFRLAAKPYESGTTRKRISRKNLDKIDFALPEYEEQVAIVAHLDAVLSELDEGVETLKKTQAQLEVYRQAVLREAFDKADSEERRLEELCFFITKGTTPPKNKMTAGTGEVPFIKVYNLTFDNSLDFSIDPTYVDMETHTGFLARSKVIPGDVLMNIVGPPMGKVSIVPDTYAEWNMNQAIARFRCLDSLNNKYLAYYLGYAGTTEKLKRKAKATAGQFNLTLEICRDVTIPLPTLDSQKQIVFEIETRLSQCEQIQRTVELALQQAEAMRQSILKQAFEGRL